MCLSCFGTEFKDGIASGGFCVIESNYGQGHGEWSFPIYKTDNGFMLRDNLTVGGFGSTIGNSKLAVGGASVGDNFIIGGFHDTDCFRVKSYAFLGADISLFICEGHPLFSPSAILGTQMGGGFEFQYSKANSFVIEFGGKSRYVIGQDRDLYTDYNSVNPLIKIGFRSYY